MKNKPLGDWTVRELIEECDKVNHCEKCRFFIGHNLSVGCCFLNNFYGYKRVIRENLEKKY